MSVMRVARLIGKSIYEKGLILLGAVTRIELKALTGNTLLRRTEITSGSPQSSRVGTSHGEAGKMSGNAVIEVHASEI